MGIGPERIFSMKQKRYTVDQIIRKLREADVDLGKNKKVPDICKKLGVSVQTYYRWRQKHGGMATPTFSDRLPDPGGVRRQLACTVFVYRDIQSYKESKNRQIETLATIVGSNLRAAIQFNDPASAARILSSLDQQPSIKLAVINDRHGRVLATYPAILEDPSELPPTPTQERSHFLGNQYLEVVHILSPQQQSKEPAATSDDLNGVITSEFDGETLNEEEMAELDQIAQILGSGLEEGTERPGTSYPQRNSYCLWCGHGGISRFGGTFLANTTIDYSPRGRVGDLDPSSDSGW
ncbi:MAG: CHASE sensor domain-containing protein [Pirellulales bacterium]